MSIESQIISFIRTSTVPANLFAKGHKKSNKKQAPRSNATRDAEDASD